MNKTRVPSGTNRTQIQSYMKKEYDIPTMSLTSN
jgi:hypothetical protein